MATSLDSRALFYNYLPLLCLFPAQHTLLDLMVGDVTGRNHSVSRTGQSSPGVRRRADPPQMSGQIEPSLPPGAWSIWSLVSSAEPLMMMVMLTVLLMLKGGGTVVRTASSDWDPAPATSSNRGPHAFLVKSNSNVTDVDTTVIPILQMRKLRGGELLTFPKLHSFYCTFSFFLSF